MTATELDSAAPAAHHAGRYWRVGAVVAGIMVVLALIGVGLTTADPQGARRYWMWLVPAYGALCTGVAWVRARSDATHGRRAVVRQVLHWLVIWGAVLLDFRLNATGEETGAAVGLTALLLLAVGCFTAGVHLEPFFVLVGVLLTLTLVVVVKAVQYLWVIFVVGTRLLALTAVAIRRHGR
jgi:hypothetical protein